MRYRLHPLLPGQFGLLSLFVLMTVAAIVFAIFRLPVPLFWKFGFLLGLWACFHFWEVRDRNKVNRGRLAVIDALGMLLMVSNFLWASYVGHWGAFRFSSLEVLATISIVFIMTGHLIPKAINAIRDRAWFDRYRP